MLKRLLPLTIILLLLAACSEKPTLQDGLSDRYQVGDQWIYRTRPGEGLSTFIVTKIDKTTIDGEDTTIIHIAVIDLAIDYPDGGQITAIPHIPLTQAALDRSAIQPFDIIDPIPQEYLDAYQKWAEEYEAGDTTVFETDIATALNNIEASLQQ